MRPIILPALLWCSLASAQYCVPIKTIVSVSQCGVALTDTCAQAAYMGIQHTDAIWMNIGIRRRVRLVKLDYSQPGCPASIFYVEGEGAGVGCQ